MIKLYKPSINRGVMNNAPPTGLRPKHICQWFRVKEIMEAIYRYLDSEEIIPDEWVDELIEHIADLNCHRKTLRKAN